MRIIGGTLKGRIIPTSDFEGIRPTTDRARETIFNILANRFDFAGAQTLDLFAGSGALGLEALSRGAQSALFVEKKRRNAQALERTLAQLGVAERANVAVSDVLKFLRAPLGEQCGFSLIFSDPPYAARLSNAVFAALAASGAAGRDALFVSEHDAREIALPQPGWRLFASRSFGETATDIFQREAGA